MIWLVIAFLVSLGALLFAAAGLLYHVWIQHRRLRRKLSAYAGTALDPAEETEVELEP
jgi:uncharacterized protein (DUF58 family)